MTDPVDVKALAETVREALFRIPVRRVAAKDAGFASDALAALDALLAEVDRGRREFARLQNEYEFDVAIPMDEQREHIERAEAEVVRLRAATEGLLEWAERFHAGDPSLDPEEWYAIRDYAKVTLKRVAAAGSPTDEDTP